MRLLNVNRNSDIGAIAPTGWEANSKECEEVNPYLSERRFQDLSTQVATQELRKVEDTMNFESNEFSIPDLTKSEIATFFTNEGETEASASPMGLSAGYRNSKAEDKAASLSRYASETNSKSAMLAIIPIDFVEAARIEQLDGMPSVNVSGGSNVSINISL